ncbi:hypothetical protein ACIBL8_47330 [Streptomyces sp. NPDC050523]|uniref:hypothetical protein n=1 Tax=Streptomyces sp. NPDC050523 TaxID=3365622 RepID=UPI00379C36BD
MRAMTLDDTWLASTEVTLQSTDEFYGELPPIHVRAVTVPSERMFYALVGGEAPSHNIEKTLERALADVFGSSEYDSGRYGYAESAYRAISEHLKIPVFGSGPKRFENFGAFVAANAPGGAAVAGRVIHGGPPSIPFLCAVGGLTLALNVAIPVTRGLGSGLEYRIKKGAALLQ